MRVDLRRADCMEELEKIPDKSIDLVITDPPYQQDKGNVGGCFGVKKREYFGQISDISNGVTTAFLDLLCRKMRKINLYLYCNKKQLLQYLSYFEDKGTTFDLLSWHKSNPIPATSNIYLRDTEYILFFREHGVKLYGNYQTKKTYFVSPVNRADKKKYGHPTVKPIEQARIFLENSSLPEQTVLDPFMGSGTVGAACKEMGRNFIGIEIEQAYFDTAVDRIGNTHKKGVQHD